MSCSRTPLPPPPHCGSLGGQGSLPIDPAGSQEQASHSGNLRCPAAQRSHPAPVNPGRHVQKPGGALWESRQKIK